MSNLRKFLLLWIIAIVPVFSQSAHSNLKDPVLGKKFKHISEEIMCVCGCNEPLEYCNMPNCIAWGIRDVIDNLLLSGKDEKYIVAGFINGYGNVVDTDPAFDIIRTQYIRYIDKFKTGFGERYRSYPAKHNPQIIILVILLIAAGIAGIFIKKKYKKLDNENPENKGKKSSASDAQKDELFKSLYK